MISAQCNTEVEVQHNQTNPMQCSAPQSIVSQSHVIFPKSTFRNFTSNLVDDGIEIKSNASQNPKHPSSNTKMCDVKTEKQKWPTKCQSTEKVVENIPTPCVLMTTGPVRKSLTVSITIFHSI